MKEALEFKQQGDEDKAEQRMASQTSYAKESDVRAEGEMASRTSETLYLPDNPTEAR